MKKEIARTSLSKTLLFNLPGNVRIVSNTYEQTIEGLMTPCFDEIVEPKTKRHAQWKRIKAAYANGRLCNIFDSA